MAGKSNTFENDFLKLIFNATPIGNIADNAATAPNTLLWVALHTADPGEAGTQTSSEANYTGYARVSVARSTAGWTVTGNIASPVADIVFPAATGGSSTITHFSIGTAQTGAGKILFFGTVSPSVTVTNGITPRLTTNTQITED